jgi:hypothetical protein
MNDTELDELLNSWKTPPVPASLRRGVQAGIAANRRRPLHGLTAGWKLWTAAAAAIVAAVVLAGSNAFPERSGLPPFTVDSEITRYPGSNLGEGYLEPKSAAMTSYNQDGSEIILSWSSLDPPLDAAVTEAATVFHDGIGRIMRGFHRFVLGFVLTPDQIERRKNFAVVHPTTSHSWTVGERATLVSSGCRSLGQGDKLVGEEVILNYPTVAAQHDIGGGRLMTLWMAPELSCFALRAKIEAQQPDGSRTTMSEKKAVKVTLNR